MEPENSHQDLEQNNQVNQTSQLHQVTPLSKYLAMALFIILPFVGGYIGYTFAPDNLNSVEISDVTKEKDVLQNTESFSVKTERINDDLLNHLLHTRHLGEYDGVSNNNKYFTYVATDEAILKVVDLQKNEEVHIVTSKTLSFLEDEYYLRSDTLLMPNNTGNAVFIDLEDASARDIENEAVLILTDDKYKVLRLPNVTEFEWLPDEELSYRYKAVVEDQSVCEGVMAMCIPVRVVDEWVYDQIDLEDNDGLEESW